jgi:hypothetical protein
MDKGRGERGEGERSVGMSCKENLEWTDQWGVVQTDTHDWKEVTTDDPKLQRLVCQRKGCNEISDGYYRR